MSRSHANAHGKADDSPGVVSGNLVDIPVTAGDAVGEALDKTVDDALRPPSSPAGPTNPDDAAGKGEEAPSQQP